jgi:hypothetical protein
MVVSPLFMKVVKRSRWGRRVEDMVWSGWTVRGGGFAFVRFEVVGRWVGRDILWFDDVSCTAMWDIKRLDDTFMVELIQL